MVSELEPFWLWWSVAEAALDDVAEGLAFSLKSVMMTVRSPTVTSRCWALLRSMFFNLGLEGGEKAASHPAGQRGRGLFWLLAATHLIFLWLFFFSEGSLSLFSLSALSFFSFLG